MKEFEELAKKSKDKNEEMIKNSCEKVSFEDFKELLLRYPRLYPADPFNEEQVKDFSLNDQKTIIKVHLEHAKLDSYIEPIFDNYGLTVLGKQSMEEYIDEKRSKIKLPIGSIVIAGIALLVSIISIVFNIIIALKCK